MRCNKSEIIKMIDASLRKDTMVIFVFFVFFQMTNKLNLAQNNYGTLNWKAPRSVKLLIWLGYP